MLKRVMSALLACVLIFGSAPIGALLGLDFSGLFDIEASAANYNGTCGDNLTWALDTETGELVISGTGAMTDWLSYSEVPWDSYSSYIKTVIIENEVTSIGNYAFAYCDSLTSVVIPDSVTSIGSSAFRYCDSLESVVIGNSVTSIGNDAFYDCYSLTSVTIPDSVKSIGEGAFVYCASLKNFVVKNSNAYYTSDNYGVLFNKDKTELIQYPAGNTRTIYSIPNSVTSIGYGAFASCESLTSITIPDSVTSIGYGAFASCESLTSITIPDSVTSIGDYAFFECYNLTSITIPDSVTSIGECAFLYCASLTSITIPDSVTSIGEGAFFECYNLTSVTIGNSVTSIGEYAFYGCESLTDVYYRGSSEQWQKISIGDDNEPLTDATIYYIEISDVIVKSDLAKTEYIYKQDELDISGIELEIIYSDGTKEYISDTSKMTVSGFSNEKIGKQTVTVEYEGLKAEYEVTVKYTWWQWILVILLFGWIWY